MSRSDLSPGAQVDSLMACRPARIVEVESYGSNPLTLTCGDAFARLGQSSEPACSIVQPTEVTA